MKLISLSANKPSFKTIRFNEQGISLISAMRQETSSGNTYNSVGKSLSIYLIHFCLGAKCTPDFKEKLADWEFTLTFKEGDVVHTCLRKVAQSTKIIYDGEEMRSKDFTKMMGEAIFNLSETSPKLLAFRDLLCHFIRKGEAGYVQFDKFVEKEQDDTALMSLGYLLGLDTEIIEKKMVLKKSLDTLTNQRNNLGDDSVLERIFLGTTNRSDIDIKIVELEGMKQQLESGLRSFVIAEDYGQIKEEADAISFQLAQWRNKLSKYRIALSNIDKSITQRPDISRQAIVDFYHEAEVELGEAIVRRLEEVEAFNQSLINDRSRILQAQKAQYEGLCNQALEQIQRLSDLENEKLRYLQTHGALEEYTRLNERLSDIRLQLEKLHNYQQMSSQYGNEIENVKQQLSQENVRATEYLDAISAHRNQLLSVFMDTVHRFYSDRSAGLLIKNNIGENKQRFNIEARIADDTGDGINDIKLFCFDWTMLSARRNHGVQFLVHDSRLISDVDPRQVAELIRVANEYSVRYDCQYILTINNSQIDAIRDELGEEFSTLIERNEVVRLDDRSEEGKLLGIQVDLKYE